MTFTELSLLRLCNDSVGHCKSLFEHYRRNISAIAAYALMGVVTIGEIVFRLAICAVWQAIDSRYVLVSQTRQNKALQVKMGLALAKLLFGAKFKKPVETLVFSHETIPEIMADFVICLTYTGPKNGADIFALGAQTFHSADG